MRLNPLYPSDNPMEKLLYCFGGGDTGGADDGDTGDTGVSASVAAGGRGWGPSRGEGDNDQSSNDSQDRRVDSRGNTTNFNIDRSQPSVTADVNGVTRTVYGTQSNLDKAVAGGDINPVANVQNNYTPGTDAAVSAFNAAVGQQAPAAAGPALADTDIFSPTNITGDVFQTPYQQSIMTPQQRMESAYIDSAVRNFRTDQPIGLADRSVIGMMTPMEAAQNSYLNDISIGVDTSPLFDANNPPSAIDPSKPMVSIRGATPAEQITAEARAAANQLFGEDRTRPTTEEVAAANARFGPTGMQPTTPEVDAYNQAINQQIADQLGISSYSPATYNPNAVPGPLSQVSTGPITQQDYDNLAAGRGVMQGGIASVNQMVDQALREVELETGVPASQLSGIMATDAQQRATANRDQMAAEMAADQRLTGASGAATELLGGYDRAMAEQRAVANRDQMAAEMAAVQGPMDNVFQEQPEDYSIYGQQDYLMSDLYVSPEQRAIADAVGQRGPSGRQAFGDLVRADAELGFPRGRGPNIQSLRDAQQKDSIARSVMDLQQAPVQEPLQAATLTEAERMSQQAADAGQPMSAAQGPSPEDVAVGEQLMAEGQRTLAEVNDPIFGAPDKYTGEVVPGMGASIDRAIDDFVGQRIGRTQEMGPEGQVTTENFGLRGDLVSQATPYLSGYSPTEQNMMEEGYLAERNIDIPFMPVASDIANTLINPEYMVTDAIRKGASPIYSQDGTQIIGARSEDGSVVYSETPFGDIYSGFTGDLDPNMKAAYDERRAIEDEERARSGDGGGAPILPPIAEKPPEDVTPEEYRGRDVVKPYQYQARGPLSYSYTGLPSLAPTRLRPSYQAPKRFSPLFPVS